jgi:DNA-binding MurR/RpiR family transcriptional regulator
MLLETPPPDTRTVVDLIGSRLPYLNPALRRIAEFIITQPGVAKGMTITELAAACGVAESTVSRFVREIGLDRYQTLRLGIAESLFAQPADGNGNDQAYVYGGITRLDAIPTIVAKITRSSEAALRATGIHLAEAEVARAVDLIEQADVIVFCAMGSSGIAAEDGVMRFIRAGRRCILYRDQSLQVMTATILGPRDVLIGISASGDSTPIVEAVSRAQTRGAGTIAITSVKGSRVTEHAAVTLYTSTGAGPDAGLYGEGVTAKWGQLLVMDALYAAFAVRHFDETLEHLRNTYTTGIRDTRSR